MGRDVAPGLTFLSSAENSSDADTAKVGLGLVLRERGKEGRDLFLLMDDEGAVLCWPAQARDHGVGQLSY